MITIGAIALLTLLLALTSIFFTFSALRRNLSAAKLSGLPYVITPIYLHDRLWLTTHRLFLPLFRKLPERLRGDWLELVDPEWPFRTNYQPFAKHGDTFMTVSPLRNIVWTASPDVIHQVTQARDAFPKPLETYKALDIYGQNVVTVEGAEWRRHRKITAPGFNEKNNAIAYRESITQAQGLLRKWTAVDGKGTKTLTEVPTDTMRLALHIISMVGFGVRLLWPGEEPSEKEIASGFSYASHQIPEGHTLSFETAISSLLENIIWVLLLPGWLLKRLPIKHANLAYESYVNWSQYIREIYDQRVTDARSGFRGAEGMDIIGSLVKSTLGEQPHNSVSKGSTTYTEGGQNNGLTESEVFGNSFILILAGHETTANVMHFALMELAIRPSSQRRVQSDIVNIFGVSAPEDWDYDGFINPCLGGILGAVMNEVLRLLPPVVLIPKSVKADRDQHIVVDGKEALISKGTLVYINVVGVHRNPKYWPILGPSEVSGRVDDLDDFIPERWLAKGQSKVLKEDTPESPDEEEFGGFTGSNIVGQLFRPARGAFVPFSEGSRSCLGRRLAQIEVVAVLAVIFQQYSVELAVEEWATDDEVAKMDKNERVELYKKAQEKARKTIETATTRITLKLNDGPGYIPVRIVRKGEERFIHLVG